MNLQSFTRVCISISSTISVTAIVVLHTSVPLALPGYAQSASSRGEAAAGSDVPSAESTVPEASDPALATTTQDLNIPVEELKLLLRPLTLEQLHNEAAAWLLVLQDKTQEISEAEIAIKRQNQAIAAREEAVQALEQTQVALEEAEADQAGAAPNSAEYEAAVAKVNDARESLQAAQLALEEATEAEAGLAEDEALQAALQAAEDEGIASAAQEVLNQAEALHQDMAVNAPNYEQAAQAIQALDTALIELEQATEELEGAMSETAEYAAAQAVLAQSQATAQETAKGVIQTFPELSSDSFPSLQDHASDEGAIANGEDASSDAVPAEPEDVTVSVEPAVPATDGDTQALQDSDEQIAAIEATTEQVKDIVEEEADLKNDLVAVVTELQAQRTSIVDRFRLTLDELDKKGGDTKTYRDYIQASSGIVIDVNDTEGLAIRLFNWLISEEGGLRLVGTTGKVLGIAVAFFLFGLLVDWLYGIAHRRILTPVLDVQVLPILQTVSKLTIWIAVIILGLSTAGLEVSAILTGLGIGGFAIALAAQDTLSNILGGFTLLVQGKVSLGQRVEIDGIKAKVKEIGLRTTTLVELDYDYQVVVPNRKFLQEVVNYIDSRPHYAVYEILRLHPSSSFDQIQLAMDLIKQVATENDHIKGARPGFVDFEQYAFEIKFVFWIKKWQPEERELFPNDLWKMYTVRSQMNLGVMQQFEAHSLKLALPIEIKELPLGDGSGIFDADGSTPAQELAISRYAAE